MQTPIFCQNTALFSGSSLTTNLTSSTIDFSESVGFCIQAIYTGTPTGSLIVELSNDGTNFTSYATSSLTGSAGSYMVNVDRHHARYARLRYTFSSGSGSLTAYFSSKRN